MTPADFHRAVDGHKDRKRSQVVLARIAKRVRSDGSCLVWTGPTSGKAGLCKKGKPRTGRGYPRMSLEGRTVAVHRLLYGLLFGPVPRSQTIDHTCRNRLCLNPAHLERVTNRENCRRRSRAAKSKGDDDDAS